MIVWKPIKPKKLQQDIFQRALLKAAEEYYPEMLLDLDVYTGYWEHDVTFEVKVSITSHGVQIEMNTRDPIFWYLENGTPEHVILPKNPDEVLLFFSGFAAKTIPGRITSRPGRSFGDTVGSKGVIHPGITPRHVLRAMVEKHFVPFRRAMQDALNQAAKESGHALSS